MGINQDWERLRVVSDQDWDGNGAGTGTGFWRFQDRFMMVLERIGTESEQDQGSIRIGSGFSSERDVIGTYRDSIRTGVGLGDWNRSRMGWKRSWKGIGGDCVRIGTGSGWEHNGIRTGLGRDQNGIGKESGKDWDRSIRRGSGRDSDRIEAELGTDWDVNKRETIRTLLGQYQDTIGCNMKPV